VEIAPEIVVPIFRATHAVSNRKIDESAAEGDGAAPPDCEAVAVGASRNESPADSDEPDGAAFDVALPRSDVSVARSDASTADLFDEMTSVDSASSTDTSITDTRFPHTDGDRMEGGTVDGGHVDVFDVSVPDRAEDIRSKDRCSSSFYVVSSRSVYAPAAGDAEAERYLEGGPIADARDVASDGRDVDSSDGDAGLDEICLSLKGEFHAFVQQNRSCTVASDCMLVEGVRACDDCGYLFGRGIGDGSGTAVATAARDQVQVFVDRWKAAGCEYWSGLCGGDARPSENVGCTQGACWAD
jgi:hypothetical protein